MQRAGKIQRLGCNVGIVVAATMPTYEWAETLVAPKFIYILNHIPKTGRENLPALLRIVEAWKHEVPLADCSAFQDSLTGEINCCCWPHDGVDVHSVIRSIQRGLGR